jgi:hypothetical protein
MERVVKANTEMAVAHRKLILEYWRLTGEQRRRIFSQKDTHFNLFFFFYRAFKTFELRFKNIKHLLMGHL